MSLRTTRKDRHSKATHQDRVDSLISKASIRSHNSTTRGSTLEQRTTIPRSTRKPPRLSKSRPSNPLRSPHSKRKRHPIRVSQRATREVKARDQRRRGITTARRIRKTTIQIGRRKADLGNRTGDRLASYHE